MRRSGNKVRRGLATPGTIREVSQEPSDMTSATAEHGE
jgi:hypothetical protein